MTPLVAAFAASQRRNYGIFMRDLLEQATDVERALHRVSSAGHLSYEQRSRLKGRVRYLMVQADLRGRDIDIEAVIAVEIRREVGR